MTEAEWLASPEPNAMLRFLDRKVSRRKRRLFACACVRHIWHLLDDARSRRGIEVAEAFADGQADKEEAQTARKAAKTASRRTPNSAYWSPAEAAEICLLMSTEDISTAARASIAASRAGIPLATEKQAQADLVRCLCGNPFRPVQLHPAWLTPTVQAVAQSIYDARTFDELPILADALEDAGCTHPDVLDHCRKPGLHARGCWVLDLLLNKQ